MERRLSDVLKTKGSDVFAVAPGATVHEAVQMMNGRGIGAVLVIEDGVLIGIFSERDVLRRVLEPGVESKGTQVSTVMTRDVVTIRAERTVREGMAVMTEKRCRHLPVFDADKLVGVLSIGDLIKWLSRDRKIEIEELVDYITGRYPG